MQSVCVETDLDGAFEAPAVIGTTVFIEIEYERHDFAPLEMGSWYHDGIQVEADGYYSYDFEEPLLYSLIFLLFWFNGAGPLSIDSIIYKSISEEEES